LYYRVATASGPTGWAGFQTSTRDDDAANAPSLLIEGPTVMPSPTPTIRGPASVSRSDGPPTFAVNPSPNAYYEVELATQAELFGGSPPEPRSASNFYGSYADAPTHASGPSYTLPAAAWAALRGADRLYYRVATASGPTGWAGFQTSTRDDDAANAPSLQVTAAPVGAVGTRGVGRDAPDAPAAVSYDVPLIPQPDKLSCWAGSMAMLLSFQRSASYPPEALAQEVGRSLRTSYGWDMLEAVKDHFGFVDIPLPSNASLYPPPEQWYQWLQSYGPLWVTTIGAPSHAIVVHGLSGDLTPEGTVISLNNPWDIDASFSDDPIDFDPPNGGKAYTQSFKAFAADFGLLGLGDYGNWRVLYLAGTVTGRGAPPSPAPSTPAPTNGTVSISGPETYSRGNRAPTFHIGPGGQRYYAVEVATDPQALTGAAPRTDQNYYGSWQEGRLERASDPTTYTLPESRWAVLRMADRLYYRVLTMSSNRTDLWTDLVSSTPDDRSADAPFIQLKDRADTGRNDPKDRSLDEQLWRGS
jgi:hypothetical protein